MLGIIGIVGCFAFFVGIYVMGRVVSKHRAVESVALRAWSNDHGYNFVDVDDSWATRWHFAPFGVGDAPHARNVVTGDYRGLSFAAFDYTYLVGSGAGSPASANHNMYHFALVVFELSDRPPWVDVWRNHRRPWKHEEATEFSLGDADFDGEWRVYANDQTNARAVLSGPTRKALDDLELAGLRVDDGHLFAYRGETHNTVERLTPLLEGISQIAASLPTHS